MRGRAYAYFWWHIDVVAYALEHGLSYESKINLIADTDADITFLTTDADIKFLKIADADVDMIFLSADMGIFNTADADVDMTKF